MIVIMAACLSLGTLTALPASAQATHPGTAATPSAQAATPLTSCTGQFPYTKSLHSGMHTAIEHGYYWNDSRHVCVGQANLQENFDLGTGLAERVRVYAGGLSGTRIYQTFNKNGRGAGGSSVTFTTPVKTLFNHSKVGVCVALVRQSNHTVVDNVVVCKTLG